MRFSPGCKCCDVTVTCCANALPRTLTLTFSGGTGIYTALNGTYTMTFGSPPPGESVAGWKNTPFNFNGGTTYWLIWCTGMAWNISGFLSGGAACITPGLVFCGPPFSETDTQTDCFTHATIGNITITE